MEDAVGEGDGPSRNVASASAPTLAYETLPADGSFYVRDRPDGVTLRRRLPADRRRAVGLALLGGVGLVAAAAVALGAVRDPLRVERIDWYLSPFAGAAAVVAAAVLLFPSTRPRVQMLDLTGTRLTVVNGNRWLPHLRRQIVRPLGFDATGRDESPKLGALSRPWALNVRTRFGYSAAILTDLPRDECVWIVCLLHNAMERGRGRCSPTDPDLET